MRRRPARAECCHVTAHEWGAWSRTKGDYALTDTCLINTNSFILLLPFTSDLTLSVRTASALTKQGEVAVSGRRACPRAVSVASRTYEQNRRDRRGEGRGWLEHHRGGACGEWTNHRWTQSLTNLSSISGPELSSAVWVSLIKDAKPC